MKGRRIVQGIFLTTFIILIGMKRVNMWSLLFFGSAATAIVFGRFYCGWLCPINTLTEGIDNLYGRFNMKRKEVPKWMKNPIFRYAVLMMFIGIMIFSIKSGKRLPVLPVLTILGAGLTLFFVPALWHRYLCPFGTILSFTGSFARRSLHIDEGSCVRCGICKKVCPDEAVQMNGPKVIPHIDKKMCLQCNQCVDACPKGSIGYMQQVSYSK
ncbi:4Fe-4S binding protein [Thermotalea metallivorans]|uniref:4Fe-4S binding protein n=1 Tax=Thermotalea metallivorans TaxID=520762 RepID=UPI0018DB7BDD|nr:4Fe-4S binding protein [Thermotalea metallivorans]